MQQQYRRQMEHLPIAFKNIAAVRRSSWQRIFRGPRLHDGRQNVWQNLHLYNHPRWGDVICDPERPLQLETELKKIDAYVLYVYGF